MHLKVILKSSLSNQMWILCFLLYSLQIAEFYKLEDGHVYGSLDNYQEIKPYLNTRYGKSIVSGIHDLSTDRKDNRVMIGISSDFRKIIEYNFDTRKENVIFQSALMRFFKIVPFNSSCYIVSTPNCINFFDPEKKKFQAIVGDKRCVTVDNPYYISGHLFKIPTHLTENSPQVDYPPKFHTFSYDSYNNILYFAIYKGQVVHSIDFKNDRFTEGENEEVGGDIGFIETDRGIVYALTSTHRLYKYGSAVRTFTDEIARKRFSKIKAFKVFMDEVFVIREQNDRQKSNIIRIVDARDFRKLTFSQLDLEVQEDGAHEINKVPINQSEHSAFGAVPSKHLLILTSFINRNAVNLHITVKGFDLDPPTLLAEGNAIIVANHSKPKEIVAYAIYCDNSHDKLQICKYVLSRRRIIPATGEPNMQSTLNNSMM